jgi:hypothetical protein
MKIEEGLDYYYNEDGMMVLTAHYLLNRGYCCGNGCKHCPFDYLQVPEPKRTVLLKERNERDAKNKS